MALFPSHNNGGAWGQRAPTCGVPRFRVAEATRTAGSTTERAGLFRGLSTHRLLLRRLLRASLIAAHAATNLSQNGSL